jgi:hypothetical protein
MLRFKGSSVAVLSVILLAGFGGGAAFAGEITGSGKWIAGSETAPLQGKSDCAFSGLNDNSVLGNPLPDGDGFTRSQSFGQIVRQHSPDAPPPGTPGTACNPTKSSGGE